VTGEAAQVLAAIANCRLGNMTLARSSLTAIANSVQISPSIRTWAQQLITEIGPEKNP
jgi:hypothetical protein